MFVYIEVSPTNFRVGFYKPEGGFNRTKECSTNEEASAWVSYLNGGVKPKDPAKKKVVVKDRVFCVPTIDAVRDYCQEIGSRVDASRFCDHYQRIGWVVGKNRTPMKDWKAAVRTWEQSDRQRNGNADQGEMSGLL